MSVPAAPPPAPSEVDMTIPASVEQARLSSDGERWKGWGPYLSERQWGTVREDYSPHGNAWDYFPHDHARSRAYRWGEDGIAGFSDREQRLCFALSLWNGRDPILKERLFGLTNGEGNHGEDVKELYYYLDATPTHSYLKMLYKYPQAEYPYGRLLEENRRRGIGQPEFELVDSGLFEANRYFDVFVEYAQAEPGDTLIQITAENRGTKAAPWYTREVPAAGRIQIRLRLCRELRSAAFQDFDRIFTRRLREADEFYAHLQRDIPNSDARLVQRQAFAGMIWSKQYFYFDVAEWIKGDPSQPPPPANRRYGRNREWEHLNNADIISMPDKWEYAWYAALDLAFHCIPLADLDAEFAKEQLVLLTREWYMHPNGQIPAYEWAFGDVNPPVHAWATWRVFQIDRKQRGGQGDLAFLERVFHKLMLNFTWWVNRKDAEGRNVFQGGFLGLDNIGVFDRSSQLPTGGHIDQSDGTSWMAMYALNLMRIALELAQHNRVYEDIATKFFEHFLHIAEAMSHVGGEDGGIGLWDEQDKFFYDVLHLPDGSTRPLKVRSMVGLIPLFAVETLEPELLEKLPDFKRRLEWFLANRPKLAALVSHWNQEGRGHRRRLSLLRGHRMKRLLTRMLDETEFLSPYGVRALSRVHEHSPYVYRHDGMDLSVRYQPAESDSGLFGGNSNWRG